MLFGSYECLGLPVDLQEVRLSKTARGPRYSQLRLDEHEFESVHHHASQRCSLKKVKMPAKYFVNSPRLPRFV